MSYGVPVIASPFTSISEICESAALYVNPYSIDEMMNRILMILSQEIHKEYSEKGFERYKVVNEKQSVDLDKLIDFIFEIK